jgi:hypothetical protein
LLFLAAVLVSGCARPLSHHLLDAAMASAYRPAPAAPPIPAVLADPDEGARRYRVLGGDLHCHVLPPDHPSHVSRGLPETVDLARAEGLDFVVLTPHIPSLFFQSEDTREEVLAVLADLERHVPAPRAGDPLFIVGFEYTDYQYGHVGGGFADLGRVLAEVPAREALTHPARFFEAYVAAGGLLVVNHPLLGPMNSIFAQARWDLSWRPFTEPGPYPEEIAGADRVAQAFEAYNLAVSELRDRVLLGDRRLSLEATLSRLDQEIVRRGRPMVPVGGSDSHSGHLRATTFVLAEEQTPAAIRDAIAAGRVCVRDPSACSFAVRPPGGPWQPPGASLHDVDMVEVKARGALVRFLVNGREVAPQEPSATVFVPLQRGRCTVIRARVDEGYAAPAYANCPF